MGMTPSAAPLQRLRRAATTFALFGVLALLLYAKAVPCVFARLFHLPCPGCGSTRAVLALLAGDVHGVLRFNPFGPAIALLLAAFGMQAVLSAARHGDFRDVGAGRLGRVLRVAAIVVAGAEVIVWIARFFGALGGPVPV
jgi:hypothetical protein